MTKKLVKLAVFTPQELKPYILEKNKLNENSGFRTRMRGVRMLERQDAWLSGCNAVFLTKPSISISLCRDQDAPITKGVSYRKTIKA